MADWDSSNTAAMQKQEPARPHSILSDCARLKDWGDRESYLQRWNL